jgi:sulfur carrier protein
VAVPAGYLEPVQVLANGKTVELPEGASVDDLLTALGLGARWVVVERNGQPVPRRDVAVTPLAEGDRLELVRAVAGGA